MLVRPIRTLCLAQLTFYKLRQLACHSGQDKRLSVCDRGKSVPVVKGVFACRMFTGRVSSVKIPFWSSYATNNHVTKVQKVTLNHFRWLYCTTICQVHLYYAHGTTNCNVAMHWVVSVTDTGFMNSLQIRYSNHELIRINRFVILN